MYHENKQQIHLAIFIICLFFSLISPPYNQNIVQAESKEKASSGMEERMVSTVSNTGKTDGEKEEKGNTNEPRQILIKCDQDCKVEKLIEVGIDKKLAQPLVENCKRMAISPVHCIIAGASVITAESGGKLKNCYHKNCTGLGAGGLWYETYEAGIIDWIIRYNKYWYKAKSASFFYPSVGEKSRSRYCTSEHSSGSAVGCPFGQKTAQKVWNKLEKLF